MPDPVTWFCFLFYRICCALIHILESIKRFITEILIYYQSETVQNVPVTEVCDEINKCQKCGSPLATKMGSLRYRTRTCKKPEKSAKRKRNKNNSTKGITFYNSKLECNLEEAKKVTLTFEFSPDSKETGETSSAINRLVPCSQSDVPESESVKSPGEFYPASISVASTEIHENSPIINGLDASSQSDDPESEPVKSLGEFKQVAISVTPTETILKDNQEKESIVSNDSQLSSRNINQAAAASDDPESEPVKSLGEFKQVAISVTPAETILKDNQEKESIVSNDSQLSSRNINQAAAASDDPESEPVKSLGEFKQVAISVTPAETILNDNQEKESIVSNDSQLSSRNINQAAAASDISTEAALTQGQDNNHLSSISLSHSYEQEKTFCLSNDLQSSFSELNEAAVTDITTKTITKEEEVKENRASNNFQNIAYELKQTTVSYKSDETMSKDEETSSSNELQFSSFEFNQNSVSDKFTETKLKDTQEKGGVESNYLQSSSSEIDQTAVNNSMAIKLREEQQKENLKLDDSEISSGQFNQAIHDISETIFKNKLETSDFTKSSLKRPFCDSEIDIKTFEGKCKLLPNNECQKNLDTKLKYQDDGITEHDDQTLVSGKYGITNTSKKLKTSNDETLRHQTTNLPTNIKLKKPEFDIGATTIGKKGPILDAAYNSANYKAYTNDGNPEKYINRQNYSDKGQKHKRRNETEIENDNLGGTSKNPCVACYKSADSINLSKEKNEECYKFEKSSNVLEITSSTDELNSFSMLHSVDPEKYFVEKASSNESHAISIKKGEEIGYTEQSNFKEKMFQSFSDFPKEISNREMKTISSCKTDINTLNIKSAKPNTETRRVEQQKLAVGEETITENLNDYPIQTDQETEKSFATVSKDVEEKQKSTPTGVNIMLKQEKQSPKLQNLEYIEMMNLSESSEARETGFPFKRNHWSHSDLCSYEKPSRYINKTTFSNTEAKLPDGAEKENFASSNFQGSYFDLKPDIATPETKLKFGNQAHQNKLEDILKYQNNYITLHYGQNLVLGRHEITDQGLDENSAEAEQSKTVNIPAESKSKQPESPVEISNSDQILVYEFGKNEGIHETTDKIVYSEIHTSDKEIKNETEQQILSPKKNVNVMSKKTNSKKLQCLDLPQEDDCDIINSPKLQEKKDDIELNIKLENNSMQSKILIENDKKNQTKGNLSFKKDCVQLEIVAQNNNVNRENAHKKDVNVPLTIVFPENNTAQSKVSPKIDCSVETDVSSESGMSTQLEVFTESDISVQMDISPESDVSPKFKILTEVVSVQPKGSVVSDVDIHLGVLPMTKVGVYPEVFQKSDVSVQSTVFTESDVSARSKIYPEVHVNVQPESFTSDVSTQEKVFPMSDLGYQPTVFSDAYVSDQTEGLSKTEVSSQKEDLFKTKASAQTGVLIESDVSTQPEVLPESDVIDQSKILKGVDVQLENSTVSEVNVHPEILPVVHVSTDLEGFQKSDAGVQSKVLPNSDVSIQSKIFSEVHVNVQTESVTLIDAFAQQEFLSDSGFGKQCQVLSASQSRSQSEILSAVQASPQKEILSAVQASHQTEVLSAAPASPQTEILPAAQAGAQTEVLTQSDVGTQPEVLPESDIGAQSKFLSEAFGVQPEDLIVLEFSAHPQVLSVTPINAPSVVFQKSDVTTRTKALPESNVGVKFKSLPEVLCDTQVSAQMEILTESDVYAQTVVFPEAEGAQPTALLERSKSLLPDIQMADGKPLKQKIIGEGCDRPLQLILMTETESKSAKVKLRPEKELDTTHSRNPLKDDISMLTSNFSENCNTLSSEILQSENNFVQSFALSEKENFEITKNLQEENYSKSKVLSFIEALNSEITTNNKLEFFTNTKCNCVPEKTDSMESQFLLKTDKSARSETMEEETYSAQPIVLFVKEDIVESKTSQVKNDSVKSKNFLENNEATKPRAVRKKVKGLQREIQTKDLSTNSSFYESNLSLFQEMYTKTNDLLSAINERVHSKIFEKDESHKDVSDKASSDNDMDIEISEITENDKWSDLNSNISVSTLSSDKGPSLYIDTHSSSENTEFSFATIPMLSNCYYTNEYPVHIFNENDITLYNYFTNYHISESEISQSPDNFKISGSQIEKGYDPNLGLPKYWDKMRIDGDRVIVEKSEIKCFIRNTDLSEDVLNKRCINLEERLFDSKNDPELFPTKVHGNKKQTLLPSLDGKIKSTADISLGDTHIDSISDADTSDADDPTFSIFISSLNETKDQNLKELSKFKVNELFPPTQPLCSSKQSNFHHKQKLNPQSTELPKYTSENVTKSPGGKEKIIQDDLSIESQNVRGNKNICSSNQFKTSVTQSKYEEERDSGYPAPKFLISFRKADFNNFTDKKSQPKKLAPDEDYLQIKWNTSDKIFYEYVMKSDISESELAIADDRSRHLLEESMYNGLTRYPYVCDGMSEKDNKIYLGQRVIKSVNLMNGDEEENNKEELSDMSQGVDIEKMRILKVPSNSPPKRRKNISSPDECITFNSEVKNKASMCDSKKCDYKGKEKFPISIPENNNIQLTKDEYKTEYNSKKCDTKINNMSKSAQEINTVPLVVDEYDSKKTKNVEYEVSTAETDNSMDSDNNTNSTLGTSAQEASDIPSTEEESYSKDTKEVKCVASVSETGKDSSECDHEKYKEISASVKDLDDSLPSTEDESECDSKKSKNA